MSRIDGYLKNWVDVKKAQAAQPRLVQTTEQNQVESRQNVGAVTNPPSAGTASKSPVAGLMAKIPGGHNTLMIVGGVLLTGLVAKQLKLI